LLVQTLNVPQKARLGLSLAAALLNGLFEHPADKITCRVSGAGRLIERRTMAFAQLFV